MHLRTALGVGVLGLAAWGFLQAQAPWKEYPALEYENFEIPADWNQKTEWTRARLRYPDIYGYPFVDLAHGGSFAGVLQALDRVMELAGPDTKLVPGHGTLITRADLLPYRDMIVGVRKAVQQMIRNGNNRQMILAAKVTAPYDAKVPGGLSPLPAGLGTSADRFVSEIYEELGGR